MTIALHVRSLGADGSTIACTMVALDGSVITALRPELVELPDVVDRHLAEVGRRLRRWRRSVGLVQTVLTRGGTVAVLVGGMMSIRSFLSGAMIEVAWWAGGMLLAELARRFLPRLAIRRVHRWLESSSDPQPL